MKYHDFSALGLRKPVADPVSQDSISYLDRVLHRLGWNLERLHQKRLHEPGNEQRYRDRHHDLAKGAGLVS